MVKVLRINGWRNDHRGDGRFNGHRDEWFNGIIKVRWYAPGPHVRNKIDFVLRDGKKTTGARNAAISFFRDDAAWFLNVNINFERFVPKTIKWTQRNRINNVNLVFPGMIAINELK